MSRAMCRGTQTRGVGEVVDDELRDDPRDEPRRAEAPGRAAEAK
jgi:hypothetical protein